MNEDPSRIELELFPYKGGCCQDISAPPAGAHRIANGPHCKGWMAGITCSPSPPPTSLGSPGNQIHLTRVASSRLLSVSCPFSLVFRELRELLAKAIRTPCLPMILFKALAIPFSHLICEVGRVGNSVPILQMTELRVALGK